VLEMARLLFRRCKRRHVPGAPIDGLVQRVEDAVLRVLQRLGWVDFFNTCELVQTAGLTLPTGRVDLRGPFARVMRELVASGMVAPIPSLPLDVEPSLDRQRYQPLPTPRLPEPSLREQWPGEYRPITCGRIR
jgi:hypothetical protein